MLILLKNKKDWKKHLKSFESKTLGDIEFTDEPTQYPCFVVTYLNPKDMGKYCMVNTFIYKHDAKNLIDEKIIKD